MSSLKKYADGRLYTCKPDPKTGIYYIHWTTPDRRSKRKTTGARSLREAQPFFDEWCALIGSAAETKGKRRLTCAEIWFLKYSDDDERVKYAWANLKPHFGHLKPRDITQEVEDAYKAKRKVAPSTLRLELSLIRSTWAHAVKLHRLDANEVPVLKPLPAPSPPRERVLSEDEIERLFAAAEKPGRERVRLFLHLALNTAARRTAIQELTWEQVDFGVGVIHYLKPGQAQSRKRRASVPMSDALREVLEEASTRRTGTIVIGAGGRINEAVNAVARDAGVPGVTPHVMRHTAATIMARNGVSLWVIAQILGNTLEQVEKTYAKWQPGRHLDAVNVISQRRVA